MTTEAKPCKWCGQPITFAQPEIDRGEHPVCRPALVDVRARADERRKVVREVVEWLRAGTWFDLAAEIERRFGKNDGG